EQAAGATKKHLRKTYIVTIVMLIVGQVQVAGLMEVTAIKSFLERHYYVSLLQFFVSFISIQLYVFFYHVIVQKPAYIRILAGLWTFESNTISIMKPAKTAPYTGLMISWVMTFLMMGIGVLYGNLAVRHRRGLFISRHNVIRWSERLFVLTSFGIIVCSEMRRVSIEFPTLLVYTLMSNVFVIIFAASIRRPQFYHANTRADYILIGQLYYLNFYALYMGFVWTIAA
ncbi:CG12914, partial [Drosophila busckii]